VTLGGHDESTGRRQSRLPYAILGLAGVVIIIQLVSLFVPAEGPRFSMLPKAAATDTPRPTRTFTPTPTPRPPTDTPSPVPPSPTPVPPTETPEPEEASLPTDTPAPAATPVPPTATPRPAAPTPRPAAPTMPPVAVIAPVEVDNGEWGKGGIYVNYQDEVWVNGPDGHRYKAELGFWSHPDSLAKLQEFWGYAGRGGGNWKMIVLVRTSVSWIACGANANTCYQVSTNPGQASFQSEVYYKPHVWQSLLNDYLAGGWQAIPRNQYYPEIQKSVFDPICGAMPDLPVVGIKFTRAG